MISFLKQSAVKSGAVDYDQGLRAYMVKVFGHMSIALCITGIVAFLTLNSPLINIFFNRTGGVSSVGWLLTFAPLIFVMFFSYKAYSIAPATARLMLYVYAALMGVSLAPIFLMYTGASVARVFFITSSVFLSMSIYGAVTKTDLTKFGSFLFMGLIGVIIASLVNIFMQSPAMYFVISAVSVVVFTGLTAYDVQKLKQIYRSIPSSLKENAAIVGALNLYLDFLNLFLSLLRLFGNRK